MDKLQKLSKKFDSLNAEIEEVLAELFTEAWEVKRHTVRTQFSKTSYKHLGTAAETVTAHSLTALENTHARAMAESRGDTKPAKKLVAPRFE